jgi:ankyrin repeat protein
LDERGQTALMNAVYWENLEIAKLLIEAGADLNHTAKYHLTALFLAIREFVENIGKFTIKGQDVLSEDGKSFDRIVSSQDAEGRDTSVIQVFEKQ